MSKTNSIFEVAPISIPKVSGHDMSHEHLTSMTFGTLNPTLCMEVMPDSTISLGNLTNVALPPFACKFNGKIDLKTEAFFVPYRLLWGGWKDFISRKNQTDSEGSYPSQVPTFDCNSIYDSNSIDMTLADQLGYQIGTSGYPQQSAMFALAYHKIWSDWYRDARLQKSAFNETSQSSLLWDWFCAMPYKRGATLVETDPTKAGLYCYDLHPIFKYRRRNYGKDYFTTAMSSPAFGSTEQYVTISNSQFSINSLRSANALQKYAEKLATVGDRYEDIIAATYGVRPADAVTQRAILLGSSTKQLYSVGNKNTTSQTASSSSISNTNKYSKYFGAESGKIEGTDGSSLCGNFTTSEHGVIMVMQSIVPHSYYDGIALKDNRHINFTDFGNPALSNMGYVPVMARELLPQGIPMDETSIFGYQDIYSEYKFRNDRVTGQLAFTKSLSAYALKRCNAHVYSTIGSNFITIDADCMDNVLTYHPDHTSNTSKYSLQYSDLTEIPDCKFWKPEIISDSEFEVDSYFCVKVVNPLPQFVIPSLEPPTGETRFVPRGGTRL